MSKPKILMFAPREEPKSVIEQLEGKGYELVWGDKAWTLPRGHHEEAVTNASRDTVALMGTSIRHTPISRRVMEASQRLRIVAKYTLGWTTSTSRRRPNSAFWSATRPPKPIASASRKPPSR